MPAKDDHDAASGMAEWLGLEGDDATNFIDQVMTKKGHKRVSSWTDADAGKDDKNAGGFNIGGSKTGNPWSQYGK